MSLIQEGLLFVSSQGLWSQFGHCPGLLMMSYWPWLIAPVNLKEEQIVVKGLARLWCRFIWGLLWRPERFTDWS